MKSGYSPTAECRVIEQVHNKHHCFVPPEVWELPAETVCQVCRLKNLELFVTAGVELSKQEPAPVIRLVPAAETFIPSQKPIIAALQPAARLCPSCGVTQIWAKLWNRGERVCGDCRQLTQVRTCRFCGQENVARNKWRTKDRMCSNKACWEKFLKEIKFAV